MADLFLSSSGTDTSTYTDAQTYAGAVKTIDKIRSIAVQGDVVRVVADGSHHMSGFIGSYFNFAGTNFTTDPGLTISGCTSNLTPTMATVECTGATNKKWMKIGTTGKFIIVQGVIFDYTALKSTAAATGMNPLEYLGQTWGHQILDCEIKLTDTIGETIAAQNIPIMPFFSGASGGHAASDFEVARCVYLNAHGYGANITNQTANYHHNVVVLDGEGLANTMNGWNYPSGAGTARRFYNNTLVVQRYSAEEGIPAINAAGDDTAVLAVHSNLLYMECGPTATNGMLGAVMDGHVAAAKTAAVTMGYDLVALGANMTTHYPDWTGTEPGLTSYQYNDNWRGGGTGAGTNVPANTDLVTNQSLAQVFNATDATLGWSPDVFTHTLPMDYRPLQGLTTAFGGGTAGAIDGAPPVASPDTYSTTAGDTKTVTAGAGVLANDVDPGGLTLTASLADNVSTGTLNLSSDGGFGYITDPTYVGTVTFEYKAKNEVGILSNQTTVTINITSQPYIPPDGGGGDITYEGIIDSAPFYRPVFKADTVAMIQVRRNDNYKHIDLRHYLRDEQHDESTSRTVQVAASGGRTAVTLGGVATTQGVILESDQTVSVSFMYNNGTTDVAFTANVDGVCTFDQVGLNNVVINNTSSTTATVNVAVFD